MSNVPNAIEISPKIWTAWIRRTNVTDRQTNRRQTDGRQQIVNVTFAKNRQQSCQYCFGFLTVV